MTPVGNLTHYFKQSLIDSERLCPADKDVLPALGEGKPTKATSAYLQQKSATWLEGRIDAPLAEKLIATKQKHGKPPLKEIELVYFPRVDLYDVTRGWRTELKRKVLFPLCVFVRLQRDGQLLPGTVAPWIPREWLAPNACATQPFADFSGVDGYLTLNPYDGIETWLDLTSYCTRLLAAAVGYEKQLDDYGPDRLGEALFHVPLHAEYTVTQQSLLQTEPPVIGAKAKIIGVLESLADKSDPPRLYQQFCSPSEPVLSASNNLPSNLACAKDHLGQMTGEFPLSPNQRNALHHFLQQKGGEILAVNGPPGTGKTTLLRSIVADMWTRAALKESEPPLIVAASNNNQAVTNILESFAKVDEDGLCKTLQGRWLPKVESYGLYCCSNEVTKYTPYLHMDSSGKGSIRDFQQSDYVEAAKSAFLQRASIWAGKEVDSAATAKSLLHKALVTSVKGVRLGVRLSRKIFAV